MRVAMLTPLPPARTGIAHYSTMLLGGLRGRLDVTAFDEASMGDYRRQDFDAVIYQLGNNPHHEFIYREAMEHPGVVVLHDMVLHHLIVEMTLARGDVEGYVDALRANHGEAGAAWARGRAAGLHTEMGNFLLPASIDVANRSRAVIVHNRYAAERLASHGVTSPIHVVPHPHAPERASESRDAIRKRFGFRRDDRVIGVFGFLTSAKRADVVLAAFHQARRANPKLQLLIAGEPAPDIDIAALKGDGVHVSGYVPDEELGSWFAAADRLVNLRYPTAGETSGTLIRALAAGKPVAVSDYAQFAELPDDCVTKIPFGENEVAALSDFFLRDINMAAAQREWIAKNASLEATADGYVRALHNDAKVQKAVGRRLAVLPELALLSAAVEGNEVVLRLRNEGNFTIRTRTYGEPGYRLIAGGEWFELPCDLEPGAETVVRVTRSPGLTLFHGLQGLPMLDRVPWAEVP